MKVIDPKLGKCEMHLFKDKQNKLLLVCENQFIMEVSHYGAVDKKNNVFNLHGKVRKVAAKHGRKLSLPDFFEQCAPKYQGVLATMINASIHKTGESATFRESVDVHKNAWYTILNTISRVLTLGFVGVNPLYAHSMTLPDSNYCTGHVYKQDSMLVSAMFFDNLERIQNVEDEYRDIALLWAKDIVREAESMLSVQKSGEQPAGAVEPGHLTVSSTDGSGPDAGNQS